MLRADGVQIWQDYCLNSQETLPLDKIVFSDRIKHTEILISMKMQ